MTFCSVVHSFLTHGSFNKYFLCVLPDISNISAQIIQKLETMGVKAHSPRATLGTPLTASLETHIFVWQVRKQKQFEWSLSGCNKNKGTSRDANDLSSGKDNPKGLRLIAALVTIGFGIEVGLLHQVPHPFHLSQTFAPSQLSGANLPILQISSSCVGARLGFSEPSSLAAARSSATSTRLTAHVQTSSIFYKPWASVKSTDVQEIQTSRKLNSFLYREPNVEPEWWRPKSKAQEAQCLREWSPSSPPSISRHVLP